MKEVRFKGIHTVWLHFKEIISGIYLIYSDRKISLPEIRAEDKF